MTEKTARANIRKALALLKSRIRFPKIRLREILEAEDIVTAIKEFSGQRVLKILEKR
jgi:hypothetical protein